MATRHFGVIASSQIKSYIPNKLPLLLIISRARSTNEVSTVIQGKFRARFENLLIEICLLIMFLRLCYDY